MASGDGGVVSRRRSEAPSGVRMCEVVDVAQHWREGRRRLRWVRREGSGAAAKAMGDMALVMGRGD